MKKVLFIFNPFSGRRKVQENLPELLRVFSEAAWDVRVYPTKAPLDGRDFVLRCGGEYECIVCAGGDGTLNEISGAMVEANLPLPLGYIPAGSTNDFGRSVDLPADMPACARIITSGRERRVDTGTINGRHFIYVAAFGPFTGVTYTTPQKLKNLLGHGAYVLWGVRDILSLRSVPLRAAWAEDGGEKSASGEFLFGMVSNSLSVGGFRGITGKDVDLGDGRFEATLIRKPRGFGDWKDILSFAFGREVASPQLLRFKTDRISLRFESPVSFTIDGERGGNFESADIRNKAGTLRLLARP
ncbi:MAG: YegS/Rv2252/BmrU family lipid kinase [Fusobacteriaceae bacterium]|jgi:YegS/Rv2252/BmrU family lipid kinase|nr:YegS/Rv2252/BmrU family lipid kinase [Fusobacteriaceae bacterium]